MNNKVGNFSIKIAHTQLICSPTKETLDTIQYETTYEIVCI